MDETEWLIQLALRLGFDGVMPTAMQQRAKALYESDMPIWQAERQMEDWLNT